MNDEEERLHVQHADIEARSITVNTGWTERMAFANTLGTIGGFVVGLLGLILAYSLYLRQNAQEVRQNALEDYIRQQDKLPRVQRDVQTNPNR